MATGVVEGADFIVGAAHNDHIIAANLMGDIAASLFKLARRDRKEPFLIKDLLQISLKDFMNS